MGTLQTWICDACLGSYTGKLADLTKQGWMRKGKPGGRCILMCRECLESYAPVWARAEKKKAKAA